jgi:hypothetical protein
LNAVKSEGCPPQRRRANVKLSQELRIGKPAGHMQFFHVYILQNESNPKRFYIGLNDDLRARLKKHNEGEVPHTSKFRPWQIKTAIA